MLALLVLAAASASVAWWLRPGNVAYVRTATVRQSAAGAAAGTVLNASGYVEARRRATVSSKVTGRLVEVHVEEGLPVEKGRVLARLDDSIYRANLELAQSRLEAAARATDEFAARLDLARVTLKRTSRLHDEGVVGEGLLDADRTGVETIEARLALARQQVVVAEREVALLRAELEDTVIRAPFDGVVISKDAQPGEMVSPVSAGGGFTRTGICTIVDMGSLEIEVDVNEAYISRVYAGQPVEALLDAYPDWRIPASVITTIPAADRQKATVLVRIGFDELDPRILPDMGIKVSFREERTKEGQGRAVVLVPAAAVRKDGDTDVVFLVDRGRVERRAVTVGSRSDDAVELLAGVIVGETVVVEGPEKLTDGQKVNARPVGS